MPDKLKLFISAMDSNLSITSTDIGELDPKRRLALLETGEINETQLAQLQNETLITVEVVQKV
ncbi:hypothetical protein [Vibrio nigripulchritudo]|uniref:hypothetical protein n=1 Tax=Vibrio nigripulchritudo TaxID=28173 RepID=UPI001909AB7D|nr:hypothetical protein [Vibrio nigripulchritudo]